MYNALNCFFEILQEVTRAKNRGRQGEREREKVARAPFRSAGHARACT